MYFGEFDTHACDSIDYTGGAKFKEQNFPLTSELLFL